MRTFRVYNGLDAMKDRGEHRSVAGRQEPAWAPAASGDPAIPLARRLAMALALLGFIAAGDLTATLLFALPAAACWLYSSPDLRTRIIQAFEPAAGPAPLPRVNPLELRALAIEAGGGAYLASAESGELVWAPREAAVLVLAGPRAGKTTCVVIPALLAHPGAAVATSTKPEVLRATLPVRRQLGQAWFFDLDGNGAPEGALELRWSPVQQANDWQRAQLVAEAMTGAADIGSDSAHWIERAGALISSCLHAAARSGQGIREVLGWVLRHDTDGPLAELEPGSLAHDVLSGIARTADKERASIFSTAARVLRAYRSEVALAASEQPNFNSDAFVASTDTVYIAAAAHEQQLLAPLVVGLISELRDAAYRRHAQKDPGGLPLLLLLDECANIAPVPGLPAMLSEGGGQGVQTLVVLQDISQARRRWPREADGMLSLFGAKVVMAGVADVRTLEQLSLICGDWDRPVQTVTEQHSPILSGKGSPTSEAWTTRRERRLPPDQIAQLKRGQALVIVRSSWRILPAIPYQQHPTFAHVTALTDPASSQ